MLEYSGSPGEHISKSAAKCLEWSRETGDTVRLVFNDVELVVDSTCHTVDSLVELFDYKREQAIQAWRASPEGQLSARRDEIRRLEHQTIHDQLMECLLVTAGDEERLMDWLASYSDAADHVGVEGKDYLRVCSVLEIYGYVAGDCVGLSQAEFENPRVMARYIAGQAICCMQAGMPPHPMTQKFVDQYRDLVQKKSS